MLEKAENMENDDLNQQPSEFQKFFDDLPGEDQQRADIFDEGNNGEPAAAKQEGGEQQPAKESEPRKNRRYRRLETQLAAEKEARIAAEARAKALAEIGPRAQEENIDERLLRMYGPEHIEAAKLHMELLRDFEARAKQEAIKEFEDKQAARAAEVQKFEATISGELEALEDEYDVDLTSDSPAARKARNEFLGLVQKLSPKDETGAITAYADFAETWELYQLKQKPAQTSQRAKEVAARSMEGGGTGQPAPKAPTPGFRGWMRDFNVSQ